jgi:regulator of protease activity HflC (stomatin/prohibitin superfamily)
MNSEKVITAPSGYFALLLFFILGGAATYFFVMENPIPGAIITLIDIVVVFAGLIIVNPNESRVLILFGNYLGTVKSGGFFWVNPFTVKKKVSLRAFNLNGQQLKVNDSVGNPIEIAAVIVWQVKETAKAVFAVENYLQYVNIQSEAAVRHLATPTLTTISKTKPPASHYVVAPKK